MIITAGGRAHIYENGNYLRSTDTREEAVALVASPAFAKLLKKLREDQEELDSRVVFIGARRPGKGNGHGTGGGGGGDDEEIESEELLDPETGESFRDPGTGDLFFADV
jgi:hypothetical protein